MGVSGRQPLKQLPHPLYSCLVNEGVRVRLLESKSTRQAGMGEKGRAGRAGSLKARPHSSPQRAPIKETFWKCLNVLH